VNGDTNTVRDDVLGALALVEATITGMKDSPDKLRLAFASATLRRANEKLRACPICDGFGCDCCPDNVVLLDTHRDRYSWRVDPA
jgi:hypothetical protein